MTEEKATIPEGEKGVDSKGESTRARRPRTGGRKSSYTAAMGARVCQSLASGRSLRKTLKLAGMPRQKAVRLWLEKYPDFAERFAKARVQGIEAHIDGILDLADSATPENAAAVRLRVDTRKWIASKIVPKIYGDHLTVTPDVPPVLGEPRNRDATLMEAARSIGLTLRLAAEAAERQRPPMERNLLAAPGPEQPAAPESEFIPADGSADEAEREDDAIEGERIAELEVTRQIREQRALPRVINSGGPWRGFRR
jgi:hypothetical protein